MSLRLSRCFGRLRTPSHPSSRQTVPSAKAGLAISHRPLHCASVPRAKPTVDSDFKFTPTNTYPTARIDNDWGVPVEISLLSQLNHGAGTHMYRQASARQAAHERFVDELEEPSAKLGATQLELQDRTALYTFTVGAGGHPFHRHQGHRVVVCVAGSGGADLRFSTATPNEVLQNAESFAEKLQTVRVPADSVFTMRFDGRVWHQFAPSPCPSGLMNAVNPAFFAVSVHTDETGGELDPQLLEQVKRDEATIASLTELLPPSALEHLDLDGAVKNAPLTLLSLEYNERQEGVCRFVRGTAGWLQVGMDAARSSRLTGRGFMLRNGRKAQGGHFKVSQKTEPADWIRDVARRALPDANHIDAFEMILPAARDAKPDMVETPTTDNSKAQRKATPSSVSAEENPAMPLLEDGLGGGASVWAERVLEAMLDGFLENPPVWVGRIQQLRNIIVRPLGLRTSPLGCPVSSLLGRSKTMFAKRFPVHMIVHSCTSDSGDAQSGARVAVVLGADDKHLRFRTVVGVDMSSNTVHMTTVVETLNAFGKFYMAVIDQAHRRYITPELLRWGAAFASEQLRLEKQAAAEISLKTTP